MPLVSTKLFYAPVGKGEQRQTKMKIYFDGEIGFYVEIEDGWISYLSEKDLEPYHFTHHRRRDCEILIEKDFDTLEHKIKSLLVLSIDKWREGNREKVIIVRFEAVAVKEVQAKDGTWEREAKDIEDDEDENSYGSSSDSETCLSFNYEVGYRCGENLYDEDMKRISGWQMEKRTVVVWTEAREAFFRNVQNNFSSLIFRIDDFLKAIKAEPRLLDFVIGRQVALLPPMQKIRKKRGFKDKGPETIKV